MGFCKYCGQDAGFLRRKHAACHRKFRSSLAQIEQLVSSSMLSAADSVSRIRDIVESNNIDIQDLTTAVANGWSQGAREIALSEEIRVEDVERLDRILVEFNLTATEVDRRRLREEIEKRFKAVVANRIDELIQQSMIARDLEPHESIPRDTSLNQPSLQEISESINDHTREIGLPANQTHSMIVSSLHREIERALDDHVLTYDEESAINQVAKFFNVSDVELNVGGLKDEMNKLAIIRDLRDGTVPEVAIPTGGSPFRFQKSESVIWMFPETDYFLTKIKREYQGGSSGMSVRVARGVYARVGSFKGRPVETEVREHVANGTVAVTDKHIYFASERTSFRIRHSRIVSIQPYSNGFGIMREAVRAKPETFVLKGDEGWFAYNLLMSIPVE